VRADVPDIYEVMTSNGLDFVDVCIQCNIIGTIDTLRVARQKVPWDWLQRRIRVNGVLTTGCRRPASFALGALVEVRS
jgi:hypothetical protein